METKETEKENKKQEDYSVTFKRWISREIESGKISVREAIESYKIERDVRTIYEWIHIYGLGKETIFVSYDPRRKARKSIIRKADKSTRESIGYGKAKEYSYRNNDRCGRRTV